jgi:hypothetical protein
VDEIAAPSEPQQLGRLGVRFTDDQRVRLAAKAKTLSRRALMEIGTILTPDRLLAWAIDRHPERITRSRLAITRCG